MSDSALLLAARVLLVILFFVSGFGMLSAPDATAGYFGSLGVPLPGLVVWLVIALKIIAGLAILFGIQTRHAAWALALFCVAAPIFGHSDFTDQGQVTQFLKDLALAGGFLALSVSGPGRLSVSGARA